MTEEEARNWIDAHFDVPRETWSQLETYIALLYAGMAEQNLISESTRDQVWARHIVDSAQLLKHAPSSGSWIDLGSGAGLPGLIIGILSHGSVALVEMRKRRVAFLNDVVAQLGLRNVTVFGGKTEAFQSDPAAVISARAYAPLDRLLQSAQHLADKNTVWVLPKGRSGQNEVAAIGKQWHGAFHVEQSVTDPDSVIIVAQGVSRKGRR